MLDLARFHPAVENAEDRARYALDVLLFIVRLQLSVHRVAEL
jgi:hypothetical protein